MKTVKIYDQHCVLAGKIAPERAPDGDVQVWTDSAEDVSAAQDWARSQRGGSNGTFQRRVGRAVLDALNIAAQDIAVEVPGVLKPVGYVALADFSAAGEAEPTSRVLDGSRDCGYAAEWAEPGQVRLAGEIRPASLIYLFLAEEVEAAGEDANELPFNAAHVARILLRD